MMRDDDVKVSIRDEIIPRLTGFCRAPPRKPPPSSSIYLPKLSPTSCCSFSSIVRFLHFHLPGEMRIHKCIPSSKNASGCSMIMAREPQTLAWKGFLAHSVVRNEPSTFICTLKRCKLWTVCGGALATQNASSQQAFTLGQKTSTVRLAFLLHAKKGGIATYRTDVNNTLAKTELN